MKSNQCKLVKYRATAQPKLADHLSRPAFSETHQLLTLDASSSKPIAATITKIYPYRDDATKTYQQGAFSDEEKSNQLTASSHFG